MPSKFECFGLVAAEAMIHGTPVIVTPRTGIAEHLHLGGGVVIEESVEALAEAISSFAVPYGELEQLGRDARLTAEKSFSFNAHGHSLIKQYKSILK